MESGELRVWLGLGSTCFVAALVSGATSRMSSTTGWLPWQLPRSRFVCAYFLCMCCDAASKCTAVRAHL